MRRSRTWTAATPYSLGWSRGSTCWGLSPKGTASGASIDESGLSRATSCSHAEACARHCTTLKGSVSPSTRFSVWIGAARSLPACPFGFRSIRLLRPEQDPVSRLRLARAARRPRRPLLLSGGTGARARRPHLRGRELRCAGAALHPSPAPPHPAHHLRLALRLRADERVALRAARGVARRDRVPE